MVAPVAGPTWPAVLTTLISGRELAASDASWAMESILSGEATPAQIGAFASALRAKGETAAEVEALVGVMLAHALPLELGDSRVVLDVVGTGGDQAHTVNISTMAALVCAATGVPVVKHGNRAASSATGTADVLEELGVVIDLDPGEVAACVRDAGIAFCFAPVYHPALRFAGPTRRELGVPTVFNILGPLTNPAGAGAALIGCANASLAPTMADVLSRRGVRAFVVRAEDGVDEISLSAPTRVWDTTQGGVAELLLDARELGFVRIDPDLIRGGDRILNATLLRRSLAGAGARQDDEATRAIREVVILNSAAALAAHAAAVETPRGSAQDRIADQVPTARWAVDSGAATAVLDRWIEVSRSIRA